MNVSERLNLYRWAAGENKIMLCISQKAEHIRTLSVFAQVVVLDIYVFSISVVCEESFCSKSFDAKIVNLSHIVYGADAAWPPSQSFLVSKFHFWKTPVWKMEKHKVFG